MVTSVLILLTAGFIIHIRCYLNEKLLFYGTGKRKPGTIAKMEDLEPVLFVPVLDIGHDRSAEILFQELRRVEATQCSGVLHRLLLEPLEEQRDEEISDSITHRMHAELLRAMARVRCELGASREQWAFCNGVLGL